MSWLWMALRSAAAPVDLPPDAAPAEWANPLALAGLHAGPVAEGGAGGRISAAGTHWWLWVRGDDGVEHVLQVPAPVSRADREALAALVASLIHPVSLPEVSLPEVSLPPEPGRPPVRRPTSVAPRPVDASPGSPGPVVHHAAPPSAGSIPPHPIRALPASPGRDPPPTPPAAEEAWRGWWGLGPSLRMRPAVRSVPAAGLWAGVTGQVGLPVRLGAGLEATALGSVTRLVADSRMSTFDLRATAVWAPGGWEFGPAGAVSVRILTDPRGRPLARPVSALGAVVARRIAVGPATVRCSLLLERDLGPVVILDQDDTAVRLSPVSAGLGVGLWFR